MDDTDTPESIGKMLLVYSSSLTMYQLAKSAHRFAMSVEVCTNARTALDLVNKQKFDAVTVDLSLGQPAAAIFTRDPPACFAKPDRSGLRDQQKRRRQRSSVQRWFEFCARKAVNLRLDQTDSPRGTWFDSPGAASILPLPNCNSSIDPTGRRIPDLRQDR